MTSNERTDSGMYNSDNKSKTLGHIKGHPRSSRQTIVNIQRSMFTMSFRRKERRNSVKKEELKNEENQRHIQKPKKEQIGFFNRLIRQLSSTRKSNTKPKNTEMKQHFKSASNADIRSQISSIDTTENQEIFRNRTPAVCGIHNHGNTCFMNAILQCLSNTDPLAEYLVMDQFKVDMRRNKVHGKKYGTKGIVTERLAALLKGLWSCQYVPEISQTFKNSVAKFGSQYEGSNQHDAQEFLLWLLDKVHEDLNTATKKTYKKPKNSHGKADEEVAAETLANHMRCNRSFIHDWFQAQLRSSLTCLRCGKASNTFDPYLCISLPVPHQLRTILVNFIHLAGKPRQIKSGLSINTQASIKELREKLSNNYNIPANQIILTEIESCEFQRTFNDTDCVSIIGDLQEVYAIATPKPKLANHTTGEHLLLLWLNRIKSTDTSSQELFSMPYVLQISREATYKDIRINILQKSKEVFRENLSEAEENSIKLYVVGGIPEQCYLPDDVDHPLYVPTVDHALALCEEEGQNGGPPHLKLIVEWENEIKQKLIDVSSDLVKEESSWNLDLDQQQKVSKTTLYECFEMYFKEEKLEAEDAWMCPNCRCRQQVVKQLSLWTVPDIFVIHLKRFRQSSTHRTKLTTLVEFPLSSLDMSQFMTSRQQEMPTHIINGNLNTLSYWSPWKRHRLQNYSQGNDVYELYAVCNHQGNMQSGHYTGYCKNPVDGHWYLFDDTKVTQIPESKIVTANAYILFYQKSNLLSSSCASSSTSGYSTASTASLLNSDHWSFRMPPFHCLMSKINKSQDALCDIDMPGEKTLMRPNRPFDRRHRAYSSMVSLRSQKTDIQPSVFHELERHSDDEIIEPIIESNSPVLLQDLNKVASKSYWTVTSV